MICTVVGKKSKQPIWKISIWWSWPRVAFSPKTTSLPMKVVIIITTTRPARYNKDKKALFYCGSWKCPNSSLQMGQLVKTQIYHGRRALRSITWHRYPPSKSNLVSRCRSLLITFIWDRKIWRLSEPISSQEGEGEKYTFFYKSLVAVSLVNVCLISFSSVHRYLCPDSSGCFALAAAGAVVARISPASQAALVIVIDTNASSNSRALDQISGGNFLFSDALQCGVLSNYCIMALCQSCFLSLFH